MLTVTKAVEFDAAHRLQRHAGRCRRVHGHRFRATATLTGPLDAEGMIVDLHYMKDLMVAHICDVLDHRLILEYTDPLVAAMQGPGVDTFIGPDEFDPEFTMKLLPSPFGEIVLVGGPPTTEVLVRILANRLRKALQNKAELIELVLNETPTISATWRAYE